MDANSVDVSNRLKVSIDNKGKLTSKSNYMLHFLLKSIDKSGNEKNLGVISPADSLLKSNINLVDLKYEGDGLFPVGFKFDPSLADTNYKSSEINLNEHLSDWKNTNLKFNGTDISAGFTGENVTLFCLDTLNFGNMALSAVSQTTKTANATKTFKVYEKVNYIAQKASNYKELAKKASYYIGSIKLSLKYIEILMKEAEVGKNDNDPASINWHLINSTTIKAVELLEKITKTTITIEAEDKRKMANDYEKLFRKKVKSKWNKVDLAQTTTEGSIKVLAKVYKKADIEERKEIINTLFIGLSQEVIGLYQQSIISKIKDKKTTNKKRKELKEKLLYTSLAKGFLTVVIYAKDFDYMFELAKKEPKIILNSILDIGGAVATAYSPIENPDIAEAFFKKYVYKRFLDNTKNKFIKDIYKNGNAYMKAVALGETIANKLIPFTWDLFTSPDYLRTSINNGELQSFGLLKSKVFIETDTDKFDILSNDDDGKQEVVMALDKGETIFVYVDASQDKLFDETVSPWILNNAYVPQTLWDILISTPDGYNNNFSCVRKIYGDVEYSYHWDSGSKYQVISGQCGAGEGGFDLDWGSEWYKNTDSSTLYETTSEFPSKYKLLSFSSDIKNDNINRRAYTYNTDKVEFITVNVSDVSYNSTLYKIKLVPALKNITFTADTTALTSENLILSFNNANIEASTEDPITSYTYDWGDGQNSTFTALGNTTHTYTIVGKYTVTLTVTTESGMTYTFSNDIYAEPNTPPVANAGDDITIVEGESVTLDGSKSYDPDTGDTLTYHWQLRSGDGTYDDAILYQGEGKTYTLPIMLNVAFGTETKYTFKLTVTDNKGAKNNDEVTITIKKNTPPAANAGTDQTIKEGETVTLDASGSSDVVDSNDDLTYVWKWKDSDGSILEREDKSFEVSGLSVGEHTFTLTVTDSEGDTNSDSVTVTVKSASAQTTQLKKTGQTTSYADYDDGYYQKGVTLDYSRANEVVTDHITGLEWQDDVEAKTITKNWADAQSYCSALSLDGGGWRLPTVIELKSIVDYGKHYPSINSVFANTYSNVYWSSTSLSNASSDAWIVYFGNGHVNNYYKTYNDYVRCVRAGQ